MAARPIANGDRTARLYSRFANVHRYAARNGMSQALQLPVFVVCGLQSSGKSALVETFLNFPSNVVKNDVGTRCPLYMTLINDPDHITPECEVDGHKVNYRELWKRASEHAAKLASTGTGFTTQPLQIVVRYSKCFSGTIVDTPGLVSGDGQDEVEAIVRAELAHKDRVVVCLLKSELDHNVQHVKTFLHRTFTQDLPSTQRRPRWMEDTIFISSHFDRRCPELKHGKAANAFLSNEGEYNANPNSMPYYISLKSDVIREACTFDQLANDLLSRPRAERARLDQWKESLTRGDTELRSRSMDWEPFDVQRYGGRLGIENAVLGLKTAWMGKVEANLTVVMSMLKDRRAECQRRHARTKESLDGLSNQSLRSSLSKYVIQFVSRVQRYLEGDLDTMEDLGSSAIGQTIKQEDDGWMRSQYFDLEASSWAINTGGATEGGTCVDVENSTLALYGGSQYNRVLDYFGALVHNCAFPAFDVASIASAFGDLHDGHDYENYERAVVQMAQRAARTQLSHAPTWVAARVGFVMSRLHTVASIDLKRDPMLGHQHPEFLAHLQEQFAVYVRRVQGECEDQIRAMFHVTNDSVIHDLPIALHALATYNGRAAHGRGGRTASVSDSANGSGSGSAVGAAGGGGSGLSLSVPTTPHDGNNAGVTPRPRDGGDGATMGVGDGGGNGEGNGGAVGGGFGNGALTSMPQPQPQRRAPAVDVVKERARRAAASTTLAAGAGVSARAHGVNREWLPPQRSRQLDDNNETMLRRKAEEQFRGHKYLFIMLGKLCCNSYFFKSMRRDGGLLEHMNEICLADDTTLARYSQEAEIVLKKQLETYTSELVELDALLNELQATAVEAHTSSPSTSDSFGIISLPTATGAGRK